ncbi:hypothetical protein GCM10023153_31370 [Ornithinibacter aureus]|uniref:Lipoprotein n=2 Tax=Ornithinibacter aureus TaxID=622664 RepID=A0ABP8K8J8_9MICO|nr:hypothetical protein C8E84_1703 [Ornithinibacter aureus]
MGGHGRMPGARQSALSGWVAHRATAGASVFHRASFNRKFSGTRATVVAARGPGGWVESVSEVLMRDRAADALRRFPAAAGMAVLMATACNGADTPDPTATTSQATVTTSTATPTASPSETKVETPAERDARLAGEAVVKYWAVVDDLAANPTKSLNLLDPVARDQARAQMQTLLGTYAAKGLTQTGRSSLTDLQATTDDGKSFAVSACVDVSGVDLVNEQGVSQVNPDRPEQQSFSYTVVKADGGFFVTRDSLKGSSC